jgi:CHASE1-domain containing sensor protein
MTAHAIQLLPDRGLRPAEWSREEDTVIHRELQGTGEAMAKSVAHQRSLDRVLHEAIWALTAFLVVAVLALLAVIRWVPLT